MRQKLIEEAKKRISSDDPSHDLGHALRVLANAETIARIEGGDPEIIIPAALFHDVVNYPKDDPRSDYSADDSAILTSDILYNIESYDRSKIPYVAQAIAEHTFPKGIRPTTLESKIVQDADRLECTGAIAIMRTFSSTGQMKRGFYNPSEPFCENNNTGKNYALDLFYKRLFRVKDLMNMYTARRMAEERTAFLYLFMEQLRSEIE